ncbi:PhzF family phenazine biosynthesis protein [Parasutterella excrementihominis]|uniref:PhzF family phenazine biosynthesis protein n=1 Tax=Parasutterella excrementihominis TaxID=487175 RepID=UPI0035178F5A
MHITAKGKDKYDCVNRTFAPKLAVDEDPVCGSGHCHLVPLWSEKLGKKEILAYQTSSRGGVLYCELDGKRVKLAGKAALYSRGELCIEVYRASMQTGVCRLYTI